MLNWDDPVASAKQSKGQNMIPPVLTAMDEIATPGTHADTRRNQATSAPLPPASTHPDQEHGLTGLEQVEFGAHRITVDDRINGTGDFSALTFHIGFRAYLWEF